MAGEWIAYTKDLARKPEVLRIMRATGWSRAEVVFALMELWCWADDQSEDGSFVGLGVADLSTICPQTVRDVSGDCTAFVRAVADVGWLASVDGGIRIPNFARWMSKTGKKRLLDRLRKRDSRQALTACPQGVREASAKRPEKSRPTRQDNTRQEEIPPLTPPGSPEWMRSKAFAEALARWIGYRRQIRKPLKDASIQATLKKLAAWGEADAIKSIDESIANGWQGLFAPKGDARPSGPAKGAFDGFTFPDDPKEG